MSEPKRTTITLGNADTDYFIEVEDGGAPFMWDVRVLQKSRGGVVDEFVALQGWEEVRRVVGGLAGELAEKLLE